MCEVFSTFVKVERDVGSGDIRWYLGESSGEL